MASPGTNASYLPSGEVAGRAEASPPGAPRRLSGSARLLDKDASPSQSAAVARKLASVLLLCGFLTTLAVAAEHDHLLERSGGCASAACILCTGAMAAGPGAPIVAAAPLPRRNHDVAAPAAPLRRYVLRLDHSGGAPPLA